MGDAIGLVTPVGSAVAVDATTAKRSEPEIDSQEAIKEDEQRQKRARGRPRLDTKDETAADRRRTQIRLAQRAYRHRKDTAITTLEQKVQELENTNAEMSREFRRFYDVVMAEGLLGSSSPHVGVQFRRITDNFIRLCNINGETTGYISPEDERTTLVGGESGTQPQPSSSSSVSARSPAVGENMSGAASHAGSSGHVVTAMTTTTSQAAPVSLSYEVVAQATPDNASFPFSSNFDVQNIGTFIQTAAPYNTLPLSASYAFHEQTFGRRLQRRTSERGLVLASMANPPPERYAAVFGFSLLFHSREEIVKQLAAQLSNMEMPYQTQQQQQRGPHEERIEQKIRLVFGYEKEFLNSDEIELYLSRLGIHIPQQAEYIEAEVDMNELANVDGPGQLTTPVMMHEQSPSYGMAMQHTYETAAGNSLSTVQIQGTSGQPSTMAQFGQYGMQGMWSQTQWAKAKLTISISMLVEELASKSVCMGKHPGVRVKDVNHAVKVAAGLLATS